MADTQQAPQQPAGLRPTPALGGSVDEAQEALLSLLGSEEETLETEEATPAEDEESQLEEEASEEAPEEEELEEESDDDSEGTDERLTEEEDLYAVTVNGEEREVTFDELLKGYSRQSDYTKKTQELSEQRKGFEGHQEKIAQELQQIQSERQQYVDTLQHLIENSAESFEKFSNVNWENLRETDPIEYVTKREEMREAQEKVQKIHGEQQLAYQRLNQENEKSRQEYLYKESAALVEALPEWGDPDKQKVLAKDIKGYGKSQGFSEEELGSLMDHRSILVLLKAKKYDQLQNADLKSKKVKNKPRLVRSARAVSKKGDSKSKRTAQMKRLQGSGHIDDASALLEDFIDI